MAYGTLNIGGEYTFTVKSINEANSSYPATRGEPGNLLYCHQFILEDDNKVLYKTQIVDTNDHQTYCNIRDVITIVVSAHTRDIHTVKFLKGDKEQHLPDKKLSINKPSPHVSYNNPVVAGTAAAVALNAAVLLFQHKEENDFNGSTVLDKAEDFFKFLIDKHN